MNNLKIGIVVADSDEYKPLTKFVEMGEYSSYNFLGRIGHKFFVKTEKAEAEVISILCGIGKVNAASATTHLIDIGCDIILNYGLSGGISGISRNELSLCNRFLEHDFDLTGIGYKLCEKPSQKYIYDADYELINIALKLIPAAKLGTAVTGDRFICDSDTRDLLKTEFDAMSCDMETAAIAYVCDFAKIPFLSLRRISDDAGADAGESYREMNCSDETLLSDYVLELIKHIVDSKN